MNITINRILLFFLFSMLLAYSLHTISNLDIWLHLKAGEWILQHYQIPKTSLFSYPTQDHLWYDIYWLFQIVIALIYKLLGINGLVLFKVFVLFIAFSILFNIRDRGKSSDHTITVASLILAILVANERFIMRPEIMSTLFLSLYFYILYAYKYKKGRSIFLLPVLHVLWVNMHGLYVFGLVLVCAYLIGEFVMWKVPVLKSLGDDFTLKGKRYITILSLFILLLPLSLINPYTSKTVFMPLEMFKGLTAFMNVTGTSGIPELIPPFSENLLFPTQVVFYYKILIVLSAFSFLLNIRKINITNILIYIAFLYISLQARRNIIYFALIAAPIMSLNVHSFIFDIKQSLKGKSFWKYSNVLNSTFKVVLVLLMGLLIYDVVTNKYYIRDRSNKRFGIGISAITFPIKAVDFIQENNIRGNVFNDTSVGGYFIWRCYPKQKAFVDGRMDFSERYLSHHTDPFLWDDIVTTYNVNYALLGHGWSPNLQPLIRLLYHRSDWVLVYFDDVAAVFLKNTPDNKNIIKEFRIDRNTIHQRKPDDRELGNDFPVSQFHIGNFFKTIGYYDMAETEFRKCIDRYPKYLEVYLALADMYAENNLLEKAEEAYRSALSIKPKCAEAYFGLANVYTQKALLNDAISYYKKALDIKPDLMTAHYNLSFLYIQLNRYHEAESEIKAILKIDPDNKMARSLMKIIKDKT